ncbi:zinc-dependent metalloprotease [Mucilaginibacter myungsuensis]|nr:zinc-dependent metalloprotease [Mucilaginibacter myungsuensis]MDN3598310.1 zinc-dependent metalloprotease [Mucilaginibacter myungsuensis]
MATVSFAQQRDTVAAPRRAGGLPGGPPAAGGAANAKPAPKPFKQVITDKAISRKGLFNVHKVDDKFFFEIGDSILNRDILVVNRISKAGAETRAVDGYAGDQIGENVIRFEKGPNNRIFMRKISFRAYSADSTKAMYQAVQRSNVQAIAAAFNIAAFSEDSKGSVVDLTDYINSDNEIFYFSSPAMKTRLRLGSQISDRSYIEAIRPFKTNIEITTVKTYSLGAAPAFGRAGVPAAPAAPGGASGSVTVELNTSLLILPKVPMQARYYDQRVGYFTSGYTDFDANPQGVKSVQMIARWRLEPKAEDMAKYKRGELVEPKKQIVYYIDPATPKKWQPYLIAGVNDWAKAFESAGFKNAIVAKIAPTAKQDSTWSLDDASHSVIVYKPSETENASGPHVSDPRSGEILETHINWFHNVMKLVHDWYFIQTAAVDPRARKMQFSDELMGDLIRFVSSHEVGHTLGLRHNYGSSSTTPVEKLRDKAWVEDNGHTPSIMDYARFNYVAQPEDKITKAGLYPRIGEYDNWAIKWGYSYLPDAKTAAAEETTLNKMTIEALKNRRNWFGTEINPDDPHSQNEDLGDNAMKASDYGIKNLKRIIVQLPEWTKVPNEDFGNLANMYGQLTTQFNRYMGHVSKNIGGIYENPKTVEEAGVVYEITPAATQKEAMEFLDRQLFTTPTWLVQDNILDQIGSNGITVIGRSQDAVLTRLVNDRILGKLLTAEAKSAANYKITDFYGDLQGIIFRELRTNAPIDIYRRNLQKSYVGKLIDIVAPSPDPAAAAAIAAVGGRRAGGSSDVVSVTKAQLKAIKALVTSAEAGTTDAMSKYHLQDLNDRITAALDPKG